jgi:hypothetical protein
MVEVKNERRMYEEKLQVILRTCLLYNTSEAMGKVVNYKLQGDGNNGFKGKPLPQLKILYKGLRAEALDNTYREVDLDELLNDYKTVSEYWKKWLHRSYSIDLRNYDESKDQRKKKIIFALLDYTYAYEEESRIRQETFLSKKKIIFLADDFLNNFNAKTEYAVPMMLLLMTRLLPVYDTKQNNVDNIFKDFEKLISFLQEYAQQSDANKLFGDTPILTHWSNKIDKERKEIRRWNIKCAPSEKKDEMEIINRLLLISLTKEFFNLITTFSNNQNTGEGYKLNDFLFPDINGIWTETEKQNTNFWEFNQLTNGYFLTHYEKKTDIPGKPTLKYTRYECYIYRQYENIVFYIAHPKVGYYLVKSGTLNQGPKAWLYADFQKEDKGNEEDKINGIELEPVINPGGWFPCRKLFRVKEESKYNESYFRELIEKSSLVNNYPEGDFIFKTSLSVITHQFLYVIIDEDDRTNMHASDNESLCFLLKVPKTINPAFQNVDINTTFGIVTMQDKSVYVGSTNHALFFEITTPEQRKELDIELVDGVRDF